MTYHLNGEDQTMPNWLIKSAAIDPEHTYLVLERMRGIWPDDFIEMLEFHPWQILIDWPQHSPVDHSDD
jgi:hypothetical protein